jgi:hypothetical protein
MEHFYENIDGFMTDRNKQLFDKVIESTDDNFVWVELGSWTGKSAAYCIVELYNQKKLKEFHCVDTWKGSEGTILMDLSIVKEDTLFDVFKQNLLPVENLFTTHRMMSWEAAKYFEDESVDFCYVDADHNYKGVMKDLKAWWPKIKPGCYMGGDDYTKGWPGVQKAVRDFFGKKNIKVVRVGRCWVVKK